MINVLQMLPASLDRAKIHVYQIIHAQKQKHAKYLTIVQYASALKTAIPHFSSA
jgi:hypothetical protein